MASKKTKTTPRQLAQAATGATRSRARDEKPAATARAPRAAKADPFAPALAVLERIAKSQEETVELVRAAHAKPPARPRAFAVNRSEALCMLLAILNTGRVALVSVGTPVVVNFDEDGKQDEDVIDHELALTFSVDPEDAEAKAFMKSFGAEAARELMTPTPTGPAVDEPQTAPAPIGDQPEDGTFDGDETVTEVSAPTPAAAQV